MSEPPFWPLLTLPPFGVRYAGAIDSAARELFTVHSRRVPPARARRCPGRRSHHHHMRDASLDVRAGATHVPVAEDTGIPFTLRAARVGRRPC